MNNARDTIMATLAQAGITNLTVDDVIAEFRLLTSWPATWLALTTPSRSSWLICPSIWLCVVSPLRLALPLRRLIPPLPRARPAFLPCPPPSPLPRPAPSRRS